MKCSRWTVLAMVPVSAWAGQMLALGLQADECMDMTVYFKLLIWGPAVEELVFRVGLQKWLTHQLANAWRANCVVSCLFGITHYALSGHLAVWLVIIPSLALGWVYGKTNSIALAIGLHIVFNLAFIGWACTFI